MDIAPADSRYVPFTQQAYCCVPTCFQMVMYKLGLPLMPAEVIGYYMGLIVPPESKHLFHNMRVSDKKPLAGYGTRINLPEFEPNMALKNAGIPLSVTQKLISHFHTAATLADELRRVETADSNALLCFNQKALTGNPDKDWGHVVVFDRVFDDKVRFVDPSPVDPKWRTVSIDVLFGAMTEHGDVRAGGVWLVKKT